MTSERQRFGNQSFRNLVKKFNDVGLVFTDDHFRLQDQSLFQTTQFRHKLDVGKPLWKRPREILELKDSKLDKTKNSNKSFEPVLLPEKWATDDFSSFFCFDGPNQWFIAAGLALALHRSLLKKIIQIDENHFSKTGIVKFNIWTSGRFQKVVVDDKLPVDQSSENLIFTRPHGLKSHAFWLPLLEKAYSKLHGSYESMFNHGSLESALIDFTAGGVVNTIHQLDSSLHLELFVKEYYAKSLIILKSIDFGTKANLLGLQSNRYYLIKQIKKTASSGTLKKLSPKSFQTDYGLAGSSPQISVLVVNTIFDTSKPVSSANSSFTFVVPKLQEVMIPSSELFKDFESATICRPSQYHKEKMSILRVSSISGLQVCFDVRVVNGELKSQSPPCAEVIISLIQDSLTKYQQVGFRLYSVEMNRRFRVHNFNTISLVETFDPISSRNHIQTIQLPVGRYLLVPISHHSSQSSLGVSGNSSALTVTVAVSNASPSGSFADNLIQLTQDMPRYQTLSFLSPRYPVCVSRLVVQGARGLEKMDRFGTANPYCVIRFGSKVIKSYCVSETLDPDWENFSALIYFKKMDMPVQIEIWHKTLLVDYFIGQVQLKPRIRAVNNSSDNLNNSEDRESNILNAQLMDKKNLNRRSGIILYEFYTYEDLKYF